LRSSISSSEIEGASRPRALPPAGDSDARWRRAALWFLGIVLGGTALLYAFVLLVDPFGAVPFSLPIERPLVEDNQRLAYARVIRSRRYDAIMIGSSTARSIDPKALGEGLGANFANLSISGGMAGEQFAIADLFLREVAAPKALIVGLDIYWCDITPRADGVTAGFPAWLYGESLAEKLKRLFNAEALQAAVRIVGAQAGLAKPAYRADGYKVFTPSESEYNAELARVRIAAQAPPDPPNRGISDDERRKLSFPALALLERILARMPAASRKVLVFLPMHVSLQGAPGGPLAGTLAECKARVAAIGRRHGATVVDWDIPSAITTNAENYWDNSHFRVAVAERIARELPPAVLDGKASPDGSYRLIAP
jgi:hypothetical protein